MALPHREYAVNFLSSKSFWLASAIAIARDISVPFRCSTLQPAQDMGAVGIEVSTAALKIAPFAAALV